MSDRIVLSIIGIVSLVAVLVVGSLLLGRVPGAPGADASMLPAVDAALNATCALLLVLGFAAIRRRRVAIHRACMLGAFVASTLFLVCYLVYHYQAGSRPFMGRGWIRPVYFALLLSHIVLAAAIVPLALTTIYRGVSAYGGLADGVRRHVRIARWTLPIWLYVSITGVLVYLLLYHW